MVSPDKFNWMVGGAFLAFLISAYIIIKVRPSYRLPKMVAWAFFPLIPLFMIALMFLLGLVVVGGNDVESFIGATIVVTLAICGGNLILFSLRKKI